MRKKLWTILLTVFVFLSGTALGISTVYRVSDVTVNVSYVTEEAKKEGEALQARLEEVYQKSSIFFVNEKKAEEVLKDYPYFRLSDFEKSYPKRVIVSVTEDAEIYAIEKTAGKEYYVLSADGTFLDTRDTYKNSLNGEENVVLKGLNVAVESGKLPTGDGCFTSMLSICQNLSKQLNGIRTNVVSVEVLRRSPETIFKITMREGVKVYISAPEAYAEEKVQKAVNEYLSLTYEEKLSGRIILFENSGQIYASYSAVDEFES